MLTDPSSGRRGEPVSADLFGVAGDLFWLAHVNEPALSKYTTARRKNTDQSLTGSSSCHTFW